MKHSEWATPTTDELREIEYTEFEGKNDKGSNGNGNQTVPINGGIFLVLLIVLIYGLLTHRKQLRHDN